MIRTLNAFLLGLSLMFGGVALVGSVGCAEPTNEVGEVSDEEQAALEEMESDYDSYYSENPDG